MQYHPAKGGKGKQHGCFSGFLDITRSEFHKIVQISRGESLLLVSRTFCHVVYATKGCIERRIIMKILLALVACLLILPSCAYSKQTKKTSGETTAKSGVETPRKIGDDWLNVEISGSERETIRRYFHKSSQKVTKPKKLPPGLQKKAARGKGLPPGWQKKIARGEVLDAEVFRHATHFPYELAKRLPPAPQGTVLIKVEGKVIRLYEATRIILDVFDIGE
jgi:hypothetical protein